MPKNNKLINSLAEVARRNRAENVRTASERDTPQIYSALAIALWNTLGCHDDEKADAIYTVFTESQNIWEQCIREGKDIEKMCEELTGICVRGTSDET